MTPISWPLAGGVLGLIAGSFLATITVRWPAGLSILRGRSRCDGCKELIPAYRLIPLFSYALQRGRCAKCAATIDWRHPFLEVICGGMGVIACAVQPDASGLAGALLGWLLATLALLDAEHFWLPDRLVLPLGLFGLATAILDQPPDFTDRLIGALAGWAALTLIALAYRHLRHREGLGQGDAKLLAAIGAWLGWAALPWVVLGACGLGFGVVIAARAGGRRMAPGDRLPLGTLLAVAGWIGWILADSQSVSV